MCSVSTGIHGKCWTSVQGSRTWEGSPDQTDITLQLNKQPFSHVYSYHNSASTDLPPCLVWIMATVLAGHHPDTTDWCARPSPGALGCCTVSLATRPFFFCANGLLGRPVIGIKHLSYSIGDKKLLLCRGQHGWLLISPPCRSWFLTWQKIKTVLCVLYWSMFIYILVQKSWMITKHT